MPGLRRAGFVTIDFPFFLYPGGNVANCRAGRRSYFLSTLYVSIRLNCPSFFIFLGIPMQRPSSGWFSKNATRVRLIVASSQAFFLVLVNLRRAVVLSAVMLPTMALQADDSKVRLLDSTKNAKQLTTETIREIFFMRLSTWPDGTPIHVFVLPDNHPLHIRFAKEILGVYPFQLRSAWDRLVFSGTGVSPTTVESEEEMRARIESTPGAIGYTETISGDH
ncbi:hypothetical protein [Methylomicrobium album]|nr:hypothetical protein [Methylomicrobium album]